MSFANESSSAIEKALQEGEIILKGQFVLGYNFTFLASIQFSGREIAAIYKPRRGEQPLWDFPPHTLAQREVAAYLCSQALAWGLVPVTILRSDGPFGPGSLQQFIDYDPGYHYFNFSSTDRQRLLNVALFDLLVNNADRKGGHILVERMTNRLQLIDHGLCFHEQDKLRTVVWDFSGQVIPAELLRSLEAFHEQLGPDGALAHTLQGYLSPSELDALNRRAARLLQEGRYPFPPQDRRAYPYPPL